MPGSRTAVPPRALVDARRGRPDDDPIFALNAEASARRAKGESIVNATVGALLDDDGRLAVLPTAARAVAEVKRDDWAGYAPIAGTPAFLDAVVKDLFGGRPAASQAVAVATPGGSGALRHAVASFLEPGQALLTTSFYWAPYATIADEHDRRVATFSMFRQGGAFDADALDAALASALEEQGRALLILNDPCHNPPGYSMSADDWEAAGAVLRRRAAAGPVTVVLDGAYAAYGPAGGLGVPLAALEAVAGPVTVLVAWTASKTFTHYGLRVGALVALVPDAAERQEIQRALTYACRGTWSNCNRGGMAAVTRLLADATLSAAVREERAGFVRLLGDRVRAFNDAAHATGLAYPRYEGGFFTTVFCDDAPAAAARMREDGVYVVPQDGGLRLGLCSVARRDVARLVESAARAV